MRQASTQSSRSHLVRRIDRPITLETYSLLHTLPVEIIQYSNTERGGAAGLSGIKYTMLSRAPLHALLKAI